MKSVDIIKSDVEYSKKQMLLNIKEKLKIIRNNEDDKKIKKLSYGSWVVVFDNIRVTKIFNEKGTHLIFNAKKGSILPKRKHSCPKEYTLIWGELNLNNIVYGEGDTFNVEPGICESIEFKEDTLLIIKVNKNN